MSRLEDHLVLNRYLHHLLGADSFDEMKAILQRIPEGPGDDGQSRFLGGLAAQLSPKLDSEDLRRYDSRVLTYEAALAKVRPEFKGFRYFQYLALLYSEVMLDRLTGDPAAVLSELNAFVADLRGREQEVAEFPDFKSDDLRRLAFFMATGSGKTLLLHVNVWQVMHYLERGRHPEALVRRPDGRQEFSNLLLITPNEGLSHQHIQELRASGIEADHFLDDPHGRGGLFGPKVKVIEIHKLAEEPSRDGVSIVLDELLSTNLVFVDEGHKGTGTEARAWKARQQRLSADGFLLEYSATFAQAIAAAGRRAQEQLLAEYGKSILFDYSYAHFYGDGYGKQFNVLNLSRARASRAHELLVGGLLTYYQQVALFDKHQVEYRPYNVERPLWVMLGTSVSKKRSDTSKAASTERTDVAEVVAFLRHFLEDPSWAAEVIGRTLKRSSGFKDESGNDLFARHIDGLTRRKPDALYKAICREVFHGTGALEVWEIKAADGELGLRVSTGGKDGSPYFGLINIGDVPGFGKHLDEHLGLEVQEDRFAGSQFEQVNRPDSPTNILIGAKKFIEGWSSWRVSCMGLLNVGKGEGSQVIQLFGRGVRLKGKGMSLKRTEALGEADAPPEGIGRLETLFIFGWNADYIRTFREMLEEEDVGSEFTIRVEHRSPWPKQDLPVPKQRPDFDCSDLTWTLAADGPGVTLDLTPRVTALTADGRAPSVTEGAAAEVAEVRFEEAGYAAVLDQGRLFTELAQHKHARGYSNVFIAKSSLMPILQDCCVLMPQADAREPDRIQEAAEQLLKTYLDRFVRRRERETQSQHVVPGLLDKHDAAVTHQYHVRVRENGLLAQIEKLLAKPLKKMDGGEPLPRFYVDWHLFNPVLREGTKEWKKHVSIRPPALVDSERKLVEHLRQFWQANEGKPPFVGYKVYLLRNLPRVGIGMYQRSGFCPDFILWLKGTKTGAVHVRFIDPHGLHHGGLAGSEDKFAAFDAVAALSNQPDFKKKRITLDGFILAPTPTDQIPGAEGRDWPALEAAYARLMYQDPSGVYARRLLSP